MNLDFMSAIPVADGPPVEHAKNIRRYPELRERDSAKAGIRIKQLRRAGVRQDQPPGTIEGLKLSIAKLTQLAVPLMLGTAELQRPNLEFTVLAGARKESISC